MGISLGRRKPDRGGEFDPGGSYFFRELNAKGMNGSQKADVYTIFDILAKKPVDAAFAAGSPNQFSLIEPSQERFLKNLLVCGKT